MTNRIMEAIAENIGVSLGLIGRGFFLAVGVIAAAKLLGIV